MNPIKEYLLKNARKTMVIEEAKEQTLLSKMGSIKANKSSPDFIWPISYGSGEYRRVPLTLRNVPRLGPLLGNLSKIKMQSVTDLEKNKNLAKTIINDNELREIREKATELGIGAIAFTKVPRENIFKNKAIMYDNAIVCSMEMDKEKIAQAPNLNSEYMTIDTYNNLGNAVIELTDFIRKKGFAAHAGPGLGGLTVYPALAQKSGMGWVGKIGVLINPQFGPRHRLAMIYVNIDNLPTVEKNEHSWIEEWCETCQRCVKTCPSQAISNEKIILQTGRETHIDSDKCLPYFNNNYACSVCIKNCPFNKTSYDLVKQSYLKLKEKQSKLARVNN